VQDVPAISDAVEAIQDDIPVIGDDHTTPRIENEIARRGLSLRGVLLGRFPLKTIPSIVQPRVALLVLLKRDKIVVMPPSCEGGELSAHRRGAPEHLPRRESTDHRGGRLLAKMIWAVSGGS